MNIDFLIRGAQHAVGADEDGRAGPDTWARIYEKLTGHPAPSDAEDSSGRGAFADARSEENIITLLAPVRPYARALVQQAATTLDVTIKVISGTRSYDEQAELRRRWENGTGGKAARPGWSNHNFGLAFDVGVFKGKTYIEESPAYHAVGAIGKSLGLFWGGDWKKSDEDPPHFELRPSWADTLNESAMLTELRARKASGRDVFA